MKIEKRRTPTGKRAPAVSGTAHSGGVRVKPASRRNPHGIIPLVDCHGTSEVGRRRQANEDDFFMAALPMRQDLRVDPGPVGTSLVPSPGQTGFLFVVADGVGAVPCGERASSIAVRSIYRYLKDKSPFVGKGRREIVRTLRQGIRRCQLDLQVEGERHPECEGMSTTLTGVFSLARRLYVVHSGDSRCYILRGSRLNLLTRDHTEAQLEVEAGSLDRGAARTSPGGHCLWNYLTSDASTLRPDVGSMLLEPNDIILACTDGLSDTLSAEEIKRHLSGHASAQDVCKGLIAAARGGVKGDDLTLVVARFGGSA